MKSGRYTCEDHRQEMMLAGMRKRLADPHLDEQERETLAEQVRQLEKEMGLA